MTPDPRTVTLRLDGLPGGSMSLADSRGETTQQLQLELEPDKVLPLRLYIHAQPADLVTLPAHFRILVDSTDGLHVVTDANFEAPEKAK